MGWEIIISYLFFWNTNKRVIEWVSFSQKVTYIIHVDVEGNFSIAMVIALSLIKLQQSDPVRTVKGKNLR